MQWRVLLVDDDLHTRFLISSYLADYSTVIEEFGAAEPALEALGSGRFDILITDLRMPGRRDGLWLINEARRSFTNLPIIVITGDPPEHNELSAADAVVYKPFHPDELLGEALELLGT